MGNRKQPDPAEETVNLLGHLDITLDGTEYTLRPSRKAISNCERNTGKSLSQLAVQCSGFGISVEEMGICVAELMRGYADFEPNASADYRGAKPEKCADLIYESGPTLISRKLAIIFTGALTGGYTASGEPRAVGTMTTTKPTPTAD